MLGFIFTHAGFVLLSGVLVTIFDPMWNTTPGTFMRWSSLAYPLVLSLWGARELAPTAGFTRRSGAVSSKRSNKRSPERSSHASRIGTYSEHGAVAHSGTQSSIHTLPSASPAMMIPGATATEVNAALGHWRFER